MKNESRVAINRVREQYMAMALSRVPAYRRLFEGLNLGGTPPVRIASILMLLFTDLHYRTTALRTGNSVWPGPRGTVQVVAASLPSLMSVPGPVTPCAASRITSSTRIRASARSEAEARTTSDRYGAPVQPAP